jgi:PHD/YefM family antitoxin component YafN of YafNO toxin-antitoxin module
MKLRESIKPISYLKAHASELIRDISLNRQTLVITQNGEAKAIMQDIATYEQTKESIALLKLLAQSTKSKKEGRYKPAQKAIKDLNSRIKSEVPRPQGGTSR